MLTSEPVTLHTIIPASDHLGREEVQGQLRFHAEQIEFYWRLKGNVFTGGNGEMTLIKIPYSAVAEVTLKKRWFRPPMLVLRLEDPKLVMEVPGIELGLMNFELSKDSSVEIKKLKSMIDFRRSLFLLDETEGRLRALR